MTIQRVETAVGALARLPQILTDLAAGSVLLVTDPGLRATGIPDRVLALVTGAGLPAAVVDAIRANPTTTDLEVAAPVVRALAASAGPCVVVAVGGGSAMDAAKGLALLATNDVPACDLDYRCAPPRPGLALVAVPTTAGTGAETNGFGVIEDAATRRKVYVGHDSVTPRAVVLDAELTLGLPAAVTAASGIDALVHCVESLASRRASEASAAAAAEGLALIAAWLPVAVADGADLQARSGMLLGAHRAGQALTLSGLGLMHGIGHTLTNHFGTVHGVALAAVLPEVMLFCAQTSEPARSAYTRVAEVMGAGDGPDAAIAAVTDLALAVGVRRPLAELGLTEDLVAAVAAGTVADPVSSNSPRRAGTADVEDLLRAAL